MPDETVSEDPNSPSQRSEDGPSDSPALPLPRWPLIDDEYPMLIDREEEG